MALTAAQIVAQACRIAKCPGLTETAGQWLNAILQDLAQDYDFDLARTVYTFSMNSDGVTGSGPYPLPAAYLRAKFKDVFYTINGVPYFPIAIDQREYDGLVQVPYMQSYPTYFATDMSQSPPVMYFWPPPSGAYVTTVRYFKQMPDITTPETSTDTPWFPNNNYLITRLAGEMMKVTNDDRAPAFLGDAERVLSKYMQMKDDHSDRALTVQLDRKLFRGPGRLLPQTKTLGW